MTMNLYVADELANKVCYLSKALNNANKIIQTLEEENNNLKFMLSLLEPVETNCENHIKDNY